MNSYIIDVLSFEWIRNTLFSIAFVLLFLLVGRFSSREFNLKFAKGVSILLMFLLVGEQLRALNNGDWMLVKNLPLHLCSISQMITCLILFIPKKQYLFEFLFFAGIIGGFQSIYTPQINFYNGGIYHYLEYYVAHLIIISMPIFMMNYLGNQLRKNAWIKSILLLNILVVIIMPLNAVLGSNYMYLNHKPLVDNPFVIGDWPYYVVILEAFALLLFFITFKLFTYKRDHRIV